MLHYSKKHWVTKIQIKKKKTKRSSYILIKFSYKQIQAEISVDSFRIQYFLPSFKI